MWFSACMIAGGVLLSIEGKSQDRRLPDGTIIYGDGTRKLPNGTIIYKDGNNTNKGNNGGAITLPDGSVVFPDGSRRYPNDDRRTTRRTKAGKNSGWLPPGQAKKIYGGSAKDYAPGQQKKWNGNGHGKGKGHKK